MSDQEKIEHDDGSVEYVVETLHNKKGCHHRFKRVSATEVECERCKAGVKDSPARPFPIDEINKHYIALT